MHRCALHRIRETILKARRSFLRRARAERQHFALVLDARHHGELLFVQLAVVPNVKDQCKVLAFGPCAPKK